MTGLETVTSRPDVARYLAENRLKPGSLMPGWEGWATPHLEDMLTGGITPTSPEMLLDRTEEWIRKGRPHRPLPASATIYHSSASQHP